MKPSSSRRAKRRVSSHVYGLDSLRAIAITGVTLFHMFPYKIRGGYLGVNLFFVLSGYLLAISCERKRKHGNWHVLPFYQKRLERIYPGLLVAVFVTIGVFYFLERPVIAGIRPELRSILFGYNNWWQIAQNADYFTRITNASPFTPMWYLAIELQFYLIWPLLYSFFITISREWGIRAGHRYLLILTVISAALTPILYRPGNDVTRLYYGTDTRIYALLFGTWIGMLQSKKKLPLLPERTARSLSAPLFLGILIITFIEYIRMDGQKPFAYRGGMLLMTLLFGLLIVLVTDKRLPIDDWLKLRPLIWLGKNSYEIYLLQYPIIFLFTYKKWSDIPGAPLAEIALLLVLASWLNKMTEPITNISVAQPRDNRQSSNQYVVLAAWCLSFFLFFSGIVGTALAPSQKFAQKDELAKRLEENQKMLQESQSADQSGAAAQAGDESTAADSESGESAEDAAGTGGTDGAADGTVQSAEGGGTAADEAAPDFKYADPGLTNSAPVSTEGVLMIGDSIMLDASPQLKEQFPDCYIDAVQSRQPYEVVDLAQEMINEGQLNQTVVISLGTNGELQRDTISAMLDIFGPDISVFWVNLFGRTVLWEKESNGLLYDMSKEYSNFSVIDWRDLIIDHPEWLWEDGEHPNPEGSEVYAELIHESLEAAALNREKEI